jgi:ribosome biogenesis protein Tsr3
MKDIFKGQRVIELSTNKKATVVSIDEINKNVYMISDDQNIGICAIDCFWEHFQEVE